MAQFVFDVARRRNCVSNFLSQQRLVTLPKSVERLSNRIFSHAQFRGNVLLRGSVGFAREQLL
jgi:hypothetical protein